MVFGPATLPEIDPAIHRLYLPDPIVAGRDLYLTLRILDALGLEQIVVVMPPDQPDWTAIRDRLTRATGRPGLESCRGSGAARQRNDRPLPWGGVHWGDMRIGAGASLSAPACRPIAKTVYPVCPREAA